MYRHTEKQTVVSSKKEMSQSGEENGKVPLHTENGQGSTLKDREEGKERMVTESKSMCKGPGQESTCLVPGAQRSPVW